MSSRSNFSSHKHLQYKNLVSQILEIVTKPKIAKIAILELIKKYFFSLATPKNLLQSMYYLSKLHI